MGGLKAAAALAAVAGVALLVKHLVELQQNWMNLNKATNGMTQAMASVKSSSEVAAIGMDAQGKSAENAARSIDSYVDAAKKAAEEGAQFADKIGSTFGDAETDAAMVQMYSDKIVELAGNCGGSAEKIAELKQAVERYNELTGSSVSVVDDYSGRINAQTEEILANTAAAKENAYAKAASSLMEESARREIELQTELGEQTQKLADTRQKAAEAQAKLQGATDITSDEYADAYQAAALYDSELMKLEESTNSLEQQLATQQQTTANLEESYKDYAAAANKAAEDAKKASSSVKDFQEALGDSGSFSEIAEGLGYSQDKLSDFASELSQAGIDAQRFASIGGESFSRLYNEAGGNLEAVNAAINTLDYIQISPKEVQITEDGAVEVMGHIVDIDNQTIDGKEFKVNDDGSVETEDGKVKGLKANIDALGATKAKPKVEASSNVENTVNTAMNALRSISGKTVHTYIVSHTSSKSDGVQQASGGINETVIRAMPAFASGAALNGIVTRAVVTNQGLVGEDGDEAILRMGKRSAVIPLSNRRHVRPFAQAVAAEMGGMSSRTQQSTTMNVYLDGRFVAGGVDEHTTLGDLAKGLRRKARS